MLPQFQGIKKQHLYFGIMSSRSLHRAYSHGSTSGGTTSSENLPPRMLARVAREIRDLHRNPPEGVRLIVDPETGCPDNLGEIMAEIEGPTQTPYESRYFQLKLYLPADFPNSPPRGFFLTKIYHPNVETSNGAICVNTLKKDWTKETTFSHVLSVIRCLLIIPFPESSLNDEAGKLFMDNYDEYAQRARLMAEVHAKKHPSTSWNVESCKKTVSDKEEASKISPGMHLCRAENSSSAMTDIDGNGRSLQRKESKKLKNKKKSLKRL